MDKPTLPKGTRDFGPLQMARRQFILNSIRKVFEKYGFQPLETPAMENLSTLTGKYGDEGDQLLFRILDSGEYFEKLKVSLSNGEKIARIKDSLYDFLKSISRETFNDLSISEIKDWSKDWSKVLFVYKNVCERQAWKAVRYLNENEKIIIKSYFIEEADYLSYQLANFFSLAGLYADNYEEKFEHHFRQFRDNTLNKVVLPRLLTHFSSNELTSEISEKGLKYDLTVPFARYVVMNRHEITFPFKRFQIQPVWRADRPQKGRYREFVQCDADVIGTQSILCEAEIVLMIKEVFGNLGIKDYSIRINHRGILSGIAELIQAGKNEGSLFVAIDKLDKTGEAKVKEELSAKGFSENNISLLFEILNFKGSLSEKIVLLTGKLANQPAGVKGLEDIRRLFAMLEAYGSSAEEVEFDFTLARGLSYYTGCIFEVKINNVAIGSVSGGGRYDNLTGVFGMPDVSGVGISFGVDRLYDALEELNLFPEEAQISTHILLCHVDESSLYFSLKIVNQLREKGIAAEVYPDLAKLKKQLEYADRKKVPFVLVIGEDEMESGKLTLKDMKTGEQHSMTLAEVVSKF